MSGSKIFMTNARGEKNQWTRNRFLEPGIPGKYTENTLYATKYFGSTITFRPEVRFDHSWDRLGYNNGTARNQFFLGGDVIHKF